MDEDTDSKSAAGDEPVEGSIPLPSARTNESRPKAALVLIPLGGGTP
jgi:hypothetical protein